MFFPIPNIGISLGLSKVSEKKDEPVAAALKPAEALQLTTVDPVMLLMALALVLMAAAMLTYAARS